MSGRQTLAKHIDSLDWQSESRDSLTQELPTYKAGRYCVYIMYSVPGRWASKQHLYVHTIFQSMFSLPPSLQIAVSGERGVSCRPRLRVAYCTVTALTVCTVYMQFCWLRLLPLLSVFMDLNDDRHLSHVSGNAVSSYPLQKQSAYVDASCRGVPALIGSGHRFQALPSGVELCFAITSDVHIVITCVSGYATQLGLAASTHVYTVRTVPYSQSGQTQPSHHNPH